jgi:hypothetical protein
MRKAGFPSRADDEERASIEEPFPLRECEAEK